MIQGYMNALGLPTPKYDQNKVENFLFTFKIDSVILPDEEFETTLKLSVVESRSVSRESRESGPVPLVSPVPMQSGIYVAFVPIHRDEIGIGRCTGTLCG